MNMKNLIYLSVILAVCFQSIFAASKMPDNPTIETRVYTRKQCLLSQDGKVGTVDDRSLGLAGIFIPILIGKAIGSISGALKKAGDPETLKDIGRFPTYLYNLVLVGGDGESKRRVNLNSDLNCIIVVRGEFVSEDPEDQRKISSNINRSLFDVNLESERLIRLRESNIPIRKISMVFEAEMKLSNDKRAYLYESKFLQVNDFQGGRPQDSRSLVICLALYGVGAKEGEETLSLAMLNIGKLSRGVLSSKRISAVKSSWLGGIGVPPDFLDSMSSISLSGRTSMGVIPITLEATIAETDSGNKALRFIADVLTAGSEKLTQNLSDQILQDRSKKAIEAEDAIEKAKLEEESAYKDYLEAQESLSAQAASTSRAFDVVRTCRLWKRKFTSLQLTGVFPTRPNVTCPE